MTRPDFTHTADAVASFEAQGELQPGTEGWWKVWGANPHHIRPGDLIATMLDDQVKYDLILGFFPAKAAPMRVGLVGAEGEFTVGALVSVIVLRWGTHNTLA